ncbi:glycosyltransferase [Marmoricola sp. RAF53]|uniref:glycosyltransferase n=1 Tax=Marmoricola sp. RAF53 TaxID=3233059 RepID=UPI003F952364
MRIMLVTDTFAPASDAVAESARHIADALICAGHEVLVFTTSPGSDSYRGARVQRARALFSVASLRRTTTEFGPDVVQFLAPRALGGAAMRALEHLGVPLVVLDPTPLHPRVGTVLASSHASARVLGTAGVRAHVWPPGVRTDEHHPGLRSAELHDRWAKVGRAESPLFVVGYAGPVGPATTRVTRRLAQIAALDGVRLVVLGSGPGSAHLKEAGAKVVGDCHGLELARALASVDVLVQPRKHEISLTAVRKALASGVPVVAFHTGAATEVVRDGVNGVLVGTAAGPGGLTEAVRSLAADPARRDRLAARARESVSARTWADAVDELVAFYEPARSAAG